MTHTADKVDNLFNETIEFFSNKGFDIAIGADSKTQYGHSRYMYINYNNHFSANMGMGIKLRVSDHSVESATRMSTEILIYNAADIEFNYHNLNYKLNPNEYTEVRNYIDDVKYAHLPIKPHTKIITHTSTGVVVYDGTNARARKINISK